MSTGRAMLAEVDVAAACERVAGHVRRTPVLDVGPGPLGLENSVSLKLECLQHAGSFKPRGAFNSALAGEVPGCGLAAASGGNHGLAVAHVARCLGLRAEVFVPRVTPAVKRERIAALGASVHVTGELYDDAQDACDEWVATSGALMIHPYDSPLTVAGQATLGVELIDQLGQPDTVVVAVGGGGLAAGLAASLPPATRLVTVEPHRTACLHAALVAGRPVSVDVDGIAADSLGARRIGALPWLLLKDRARSVLVDDAEIVRARELLWREARIVAEPGGVTALAALTAGVVEFGSDERVAVVVCGANTDPSDLG